LLRHTHGYLNIASR